MTSKLSSFLIWNSLLELDLNQLVTILLLVKSLWYFPDLQNGSTAEFSYGY